MSLIWPGPLYLRNPIPLQLQQHPQPTVKTLLVVRRLPTQQHGSQIFSCVLYRNTRIRPGLPKSLEDSKRAHYLRFNSLSRGSRILNPAWRYIGAELEKSSGHRTGTWIKKPRFSGHIASQREKLAIFPHQQPLHALPEHSADPQEYRRPDFLLPPFHMRKINPGSPRCAAQIPFASGRTPARGIWAPDRLEPAQCLHRSSESHAHYHAPTRHPGARQILRHVRRIPHTRITLPPRRSQRRRTRRRSRSLVPSNQSRYHPAFCSSVLRAWTCSEHFREPVPFPPKYPPAKWGASRRLEWNRAIDGGGAENSGQWVIWPDSVNWRFILLLRQRFRALQWAVVTESSW